MKPLFFADLGILLKLKVFGYLGLDLGFLLRFSMFSIERFTVL